MPCLLGKTWLILSDSTWKPCDPASRKKAAVVLTAASSFRISIWHLNDGRRQLGARSTGADEDARTRVVIVVRGTA